jgi:sialate O-acetylesterase
MKIIYKITFMVLGLLSGLNLFAQQKTTLKLSNVLQSNMVIQQGKSFKVWGQASPLAKVTITADWLKKEVSVNADNQGNFSGAIDVPQAKPGNFDVHRLTATSASDKVTLDNVLIGDVWFCSGQSNMQFKLQEDKDAATSLPAANHPNIRLFNTELNFSATPILNVKGKWQTCTPETVKDFSAVGYYFGEYLQKEINIPVGLIFSGIGASKVEAFIPQEALKSHPLLDSVYLEPYLRSEKSKEVINGGFSFEKVTRPFLLYNALINPFTNLSIKGFCWYQGEGNRMERDSYTLATQTLIREWRKKFAQGELPFYYVQVAPFFYDKEDPKLADYAFFREAQEKISSVKNTAMVVSMDVGEGKDLHPKKKMPLGIRLAKTALNQTYRRHIDYLGPKFQKIAVKGDRVSVFFKKASIKSGLGTNNHDAPKYFTLAGEDGIFYPAEAKIVDQHIEVWSIDVKKPVAVRYAFTNYPVTNLQNNDGLPAIPFRSDKWQEHSIVDSR